MREYQVNGYSWAIMSPMWKPLYIEEAERQFASLYYRQSHVVAYPLYLEAVKTDDLAVAEAWQAFRQGIEDSQRIFIDDDNAAVLLDVSAIAQATGFHRAYVNAEIKAGRLSACRDGREWRINVDDYLAWLGNRLKT